MLEKQIQDVIEEYLKNYLQIEIDANSHYGGHDEYVSEVTIRLILKGKPISTSKVSL